jgi:hypothetical protein
MFKVDRLPSDRAYSFTFSLFSYKDLSTKKSSPGYLTVNPYPLVPFFKKNASNFLIMNFIRNKNKKQRTYYIKPYWNAMKISENVLNSSFISMIPPSYLFVVTVVIFSEQCNVFLALLFIGTQSN